VRALIFSTLLALAVPAAAQATRELPDFKALMKEEGPAVVNIISVRKAEKSAGAAAGGDAPARGEGLGSGFIISPDGYILTNAHLVADAEDVTVRLADAKREFRATLVGADKSSDVALLKVQAMDLPTVRLGSSAALEPGDWVAAIGSPFGFANTITAGIVSAKGRSLPDELYVPFIQTDVAVNPGNSGGPLLNLQGEVVGINSLIYSGTGGYMGVSFAIPIEVALDVSQALKSRGKVTRGRAGISAQPLTKELARSFKVDSTSGAIIVNLEKGGPAERAGARVGDVILEWNGAAIGDPAELPRLVAATPPGSTARMTVSRAGERKTLALTVDEMPTEAPPARSQPAGASADTLGMALRDLTPPERTALGVDYGLMVRDVSGAPAAGSAILAGDVIIGVAETPIRSRQEFDALIARHAKGEPLALLVRRGEATLYVALAAGGAG
jgi:serine protease Do